MTNQQTETEKLRERIEPMLKALYWQGRRHHELPIDSISVNSELDQILRACKEEGLKFVPNEWILERLTFRTRDITGEVVEAINSQIKEIELE